MSKFLDDSSTVFDKVDTILETRVLYFPMCKELLDILVAKIGYKRNQLSTISGVAFRTAPPLVRLSHFNR